MTRNRGKKALYEVMSKARAKAVQSKTPEQVRPKETEDDKPAAQQKAGVAEAPTATAKWRTRPRIVQFNAGRFEFSVPYQVAVVFVLVFVFLVLAAYRLGQNSNLSGLQAAGETGGQVPVAEGESPTEQAAVELPEPLTAPEVVRQDAVEAEPAKPVGDNVIVLAWHSTRSQLVPARDHFNSNGIETEIIQEDGRYSLQTVERFNANPATPGTNGYETKRRIIEVGATYKAPPGYETFARHLFSDAYGKKVD